MQLCQNLNDLESIEWAALSLFLPSVHLRLLLDSWIQTIDPSSTFTVKSLMDDLVGSLDFQVKEVYSAFWMDHIPKTIKISFGNSA